MNFESSYFVFRHDYQVHSFEINNRDRLPALSRVNLISAGVA